MSEFSINALRFEDVRAAIIEYLKDNSPYAGDFDFDASNIGYEVDIAAYQTMLQSYHNVLIANNIFIDTTEIRLNAISLSKPMGYRPKRKVASRFSGTITYFGDSGASPPQTFVQGDTIVIPARTLFTGGAYSFINLVPITLTYQNATLLSGDFVVYEGTFRNVTSYGTGKKFQSITINSANVEEYNLSVYLRTTNTSSTTNIQQTRADSFFTSENNAIYFVEEDILNEYMPKILFGDGDLGDIPSQTQTIDIEYLETNGNVANGQTTLSFSGTPSTSITRGSGSTFVYDYTQLSIDIPAQQVSYGGKDNESLEDIKFNAPRFYASGDRGVTGNDIISIFTRFGSTLKYYNVEAGNVLYPANSDTERGNTYITAVPYFTEGEAFLDNGSIYLTTVEENEILPQVALKVIIATERKFLKPTYLYLELNPYIEVNANYSDEEIQSIITAASTNVDTYRTDNLMGLGKTFRYAKIQSSITNTTGVKSTDVDITHNFVITYDSFYTSKNSTLHLPVIYSKSNSGTILYDTNNNPIFSNFIKKRSTILAEKNSVLSAANQFTQFTLPISDSSIYGPLNHKNSTRYMYNIDVSRVEILTFIEAGASGSEFLNYESNSFIDSDGTTRTSNLYETATDTWQIQLNGRNIGTLKKVAGSYTIYQPDESFLASIGVEPEVSGSITTWLKLDSVTEIDEAGDSSTYYSISFLLENTTYSDVRIYSNNTIGDVIFDPQLFVWTWSNLGTLLDENDGVSSYSVYIPTINDEENLLEISHATGGSNIILSVRNYNGSFSLNNFNSNYLLEYDQRNDFSMTANYTMARYDTSADSSEIYVDYQFSRSGVASAQFEQIITINEIKQTEITTITNTDAGSGIGILASKWFHLYSANNTTHYYVWYRDGLLEESTLTCDNYASLATSGTADYFTFEVYSKLGVKTKYYAWFNIGTATDPAIATYTGIALVPTTSETTANLMSAKLKLLIDVFSLDITVTDNTGTITITNNYPGLATLATDYIADATWTFARNTISTTVVDPIPYQFGTETWTPIPVSVIANDTDETVAAKTAAAITDVIDFTSTNTLEVVNVTWATYGKATVLDGDSPAATDSWTLGTGATGFTFATSSTLLPDGSYNTDANIELMSAGDYLTISGATDTENTGTFQIKEVGTTIQYNLVDSSGNLITADVGSSCIPTGTDEIATEIVPDGTITIYNKNGIAAVDGIGTLYHMQVATGTYGDYTIKSFDLYHDVSIGTLNYNSGELVFDSIIKGYTDYSNKNTILRNISDVFDNYGKSWDTNNVQMNKIQITPVDDYSNTGVLLGQLNDFDTLFNQCMQISITTPVIKK